MNKLDYSVSLRAKGLVTEEIKEKMKEKGFDDSEVEYYLKKSDEVILNRLVTPKKSNSGGMIKNTVKMVVLILSLGLLLLVLLGYARIGLLGLFLVLVLIGYSSFSR